MRSQRSSRATLTWSRSMQSGTIGFVSIRAYASLPRWQLALVSKTVMSWVDLVEAMDADAREKKRGPHKKAAEQISNRDTPQDRAGGPAPR
jgi:hypothetical protein